MILGLGSYTYGWAVGVRGQEPANPLDEQGLLDRCREHGIKLLQIGDNLPLHSFSTSRVDKLAARAALEGVQLELGARRLTVERVTQYALLARRIGARLIRFVIDDIDYHPSSETIIDCLNQCVPDLDGLTLALENHDRIHAVNLRAIIDAVGSNRIGVCLDTANSLGAGEGIDAVATILAPLTVNLHLKDYSIERLPHLMGFKVTGRPVGAGMLNVPLLVQKLAQHGRCQTAILELWTPPEAEMEQTLAKEAAWAVQSIEVLKNWFS